MSERVWRVVCEWDIGQEYQVFKTDDGAWEWAIQALINCGIDDDPDDLNDQGLVYVEDLELLP